MNEKNNQGRVIHEGATTGDIYEDIKNNLGIDIRNNKNYLVIYDSMAGDDGISETTYTTYKVIKVDSLAASLLSSFKDKWSESEARDWLSEHNVFYRRKLDSKEDEKENVLCEGVASDDIYRDIERKLGIDIRNNPDYMIVYESVTDDDGRSDVLYNRYKVIKNEVVLPPPPPPPPPPPVPPVPPVPPEPPEQDDEDKRKKRNILDFFKRRKKENEDKETTKDNKNERNEGENQTFGKGDDKTPGKGDDKTPGKGDDKTPGKGDDKTPGKGDDKTPGKGDDKTPGKGDDKTPGKGDDKTPGKGDDKTPGKGDDKTPGKGDDKTPGKDRKRPKPIIRTEDEIQELIEQRIEEELKIRIQDMLDKYYGNPEKEKEYRMRMKRFKSHLKDTEFEYVNASGEKVTIPLKKIGDYPEKAEDEKFLQLEEYNYRLERLAMANAGDFSRYRDSAAMHYKMLHDLAKERLNIALLNSDKKYYDKCMETLKELEKDKENILKQSMQLLVDADADYISTNNFAYNQHQSTQTNMKTLGKHGEQVPYIPLHDSDEKSDKVKNVGIGVMNGLLFVRNNVSARIDQGIGTFVVAPIHSVLFNSDIMSSGIYKGLASHRYAARREYYEDKYEAELRAQNADVKDGEKLKRPSVMKLVFGVRKDALVNYREGNVAVLNAGASDIETSVKQSVEAQVRKEVMAENIAAKEFELLERIDELRDELEKTTDQSQREAIQNNLQMCSQGIMTLQHERELNDLVHVPSVVQTDAISIATHSEENKANITKVVSGIKLAAKTAAMHYVGQNLTKFVQDKIVTPVEHPGGYEIDYEHLPGEMTQEPIVVTPEQVIENEVPITLIDREAMNELTIGDLLRDGSEVSIRASQGTSANVTDLEYLRGMSLSGSETFVGTGIGDPCINGKGAEIISAADGIGFDLAGRITVPMEPIEEQTKLMETLTKMLSDAAGKTITPDNIYDIMDSSEDPVSTVTEFLENINILASSRAEGMPSGWLPPIEDAREMAESLVEASTKVVRDVIPEQIEYIPKYIPGEVIEVITELPPYTTYEVSEVMREVLDGRMVALFTTLGLSTIPDVYEILRRTRSKDEVSQLAEPTKVEAWEKDNKPQERDYNNSKWGFSGTEKEDRATGYFDGEETASQAKKNDSMDEI